MESIRKLELMAAEWYEKAPHLPVRGRVWLAQNVWWIGLVCLILGTFGVLSVLIATFWASTAFGVYGGAAGVVIGSLAFVAVLIALAFSILLLILLAMAIAPLRTGRKRGWDLLFISTLISLASAVVGFLLSFNLGSLLAGLLAAVITGYFLFEIRSYFKVDRLDIKRGA